MVKCNIFRPLSAPTGEFLMFGQYADDLTKEQAGKSTYRVVPSKFVVLDLDLTTALGSNTNITPNLTNGTFTFPDNTTINNPSAVLVQMFQSYYENSVACADAEAANSGSPLEGHEYSFEMFWRFLERMNLISIAPGTVTDPDLNSPGFPYYDQVKFIGDINIHSSRNVDGYNYDEVFCHIPANEDEYYYRLSGGNEIPFMVTDNEYICGWDAHSYPVNYPLSGYNITTQHTGSNGYVFGGLCPDPSFSGDPNLSPVKRHVQSVQNVDYRFNAILVLYDVIHSEPGESPLYLHRNRPMGIWLAGPVVSTNGTIIGLNNTVTKFITNNDAYGQGSGFGLRIMTRYVPTPNSSTYTTEVSTETGDYESIAVAMGRIADTISEFRADLRNTQNISQAFKDHMAQFRNNRTNVPYVRSVAGQDFWFINGRNTGRPVHPPRVQIVQPEHGDITITYNGTPWRYNIIECVPGDTIGLTAVPDTGYSFDFWTDGDTNPTKTITVSHSLIISANFHNTMQ